jgi:spermidine synthase
MLQASHPARFTGLVAAVLLVTSFYRPGSQPAETTRSFFGVHKVVESADGRFRVLIHGTTIHGAQRIRDDAGNLLTGRPEPSTYYYGRSPMTEVIETTRAAKGVLNHVMIVGLGSGSLACRSRPGESWTYFEIDPAVIEIARNKSKFRMLSDCAPTASIVLGDARLTIAEASVPADLIVLDAFSSDVVPVHLLTREALGLYLSKLAPNGVLMFHISNRYLELPSVVTALAAERGLATYLRRDKSVTREDFQRDMHAGSIVAVVARSEADRERRMEEADRRSFAAALDRRFLQRARGHVADDIHREIVPRRVFTFENRFRSQAEPVCAIRPQPNDWRSR